MTDTVDHGRGWRNAVRLFLEEQRTYGSVLEHSWLFSAFEIERPNDETPNKQAQKLQLEYLGEFEKFRIELLEELQMDLQTVPGTGYAVIHPTEQTKRAESDFSREIKKIVRKTASRLANVDHSLLTAAQQQENADAIARLSNLRGLVRKSYGRLLTQNEDSE